MNTMNTSKTTNNQQPIIVGLDIGTTKVVAIAGQKNEYGKIDILGMGLADSAGVDHGVVLNIEECTQSIENALGALKMKNPDLVINEVYVGIAGKHIKSMQVKGEIVRGDSDIEITKEDVDKLINDQRQLFIPAGDQIIDIIPQEFRVDDAPRKVNPVGMYGVKLGATFHVITGDKFSIRNIKRCVDKLGLVTQDLVLQPLASAAAILSAEDLEAGVAVIDIGGGTTDLAIFHDGILKHTAVIPYAGTNITEDIRKILQVLKAQAEAMKVKFGTALAQEANPDAYITIPGLRGLPPKEIAVRNLAAIIEARMKEILEFAMDELKTLNIDHELFGGIILTGGGSELQNVLQLTEFVTGFNARIGYPVEHVSANNIKELENPRYSTCIGLILRGYSDYEAGKIGSTNSLTSKEEVELTFQEKATEKNELETSEVQKEASQVVENEDFNDTKEDVTTQTWGGYEDREDKTKEKNTIKKIFDSIKTSIVNIFEDVNDDKID